jgi:hypothetical protein
MNSNIVKYARDCGPDDLALCWRGKKKGEYTYSLLGKYISKSNDEATGRIDVQFEKGIVDGGEIKPEVKEVLENYEVYNRGSKVSTSSCKELEIEDATNTVNELNEQIEEVSKSFDNFANLEKRAALENQINNYYFEIRRLNKLIITDRKNQDSYTRSINMYTREIDILQRKEDELKKKAEPYDSLIESLRHAEHKLYILRKSGGGTRRRRKLRRSKTRRTRFYL